MRAIFIVLLIAVTLSAKDWLIADFEGPDYGDWTAEGTAFGKGPARGTLPNQMPVTDFQGHGLVNSYTGGDRAVGRLTSPVFVLNHPYISFLVGGGGWKETRMDLLVENQAGQFDVARTISGTNVVSGGSEALRPSFWDVSDLKGKHVRLEIVDECRTGWGHISIDHIMALEQKPPLPSYNVSFDLTVTEPWLLLPIDNTARMSQLKLYDGDTLLHTLAVQLSDKPTWYPPLNLAAWSGKRLTAVIDCLPHGSRLTSSFQYVRTPPVDPAPYTETYRPFIHFTPYRGWNNDPNGLVFYNGEYHLFFQHNPYGVNWGNMHWGHAVSKDLFQWTELGDVLAPDSLGPMFSGSAVVDVRNTSGFGKDGKTPLVLIYTAAGNPAVQCLAYSLDGRTFTKYDGNPVLPNQTAGNRDPKVFWHEQSQAWIMALYVTRPNKIHTVELWSSPNLREWTKASSFTGGQNGSRFLYECPELFEIPVEGTQETRWIIYGGNGDYAIGHFDGFTFSLESGPFPGHRGRNLYASQTFNSEPLNRRIQMYWMQAGTAPGMNFSQGMTIPQELKLIHTANGLRLAHVPLTPPLIIGPRLLTIPFDSHAFPLPSADVFRCQIQVDTLSADAIIGGTFRGIDIRYNHAIQKLTIGAISLDWPTDSNHLELILFVDKTAIECFSGDGLNFGVVALRPQLDNHDSNIHLFQGNAANKTVRFTEFRAHTTKLIHHQEFHQ